MADQFHANRDRWLAQLYGDPALSGCALAVALALGFKFLNRQSGTAWPSIPTLCEATGRKRGAVIKALADLRERGHLTIEEGRGRANTNVYRLKLSAADKQSGKPNHLGAEKRSEKPNHSANKRCGFRTEKVPLSDGKGTVFDAEKVPKTAPEPCRKNPEEEPFEEPHDRGGDDSPSIDSLPFDPDAARQDPNEALSGDVLGSTDAAFADFWASYPKRIGQQNATAAFAAVIAEGVPPEALIEAAHAATAIYQGRLAKGEAEGEVHRYTKTPANFLSQGAWRDAPAEAARLAPRATPEDEWQAFLNMPSVVTGGAR